MPRELLPPPEMNRSPRGPNVPTTQAHYSDVVSVQGDSVGLREVTAPLWRGKAAIAVGAVLGVLIGLMTSWFTTPSYRARASLQLEGINDEHFLHELTPISPALPNASPENYLQNQVKLLESDTLAKRVAERVGTPPGDSPRGIVALAAQLRTQLGFLKPWSLTSEERRIKNVHEALTVRTSLQSQVVELFYDAHDPNLAAVGANAAASELIDLNREARMQLVRDTTEWLNQQAVELKTKLETSNQQLQDFARSSGLVFAGQQSTLAQDKMRQIQEELARAEADRAAKQARFEAAEADGSGLGSQVPENGALRQSQVDLQNMRRQLAQLRTLYTTNNIKVQQLQAQIAETEKALESSRADIVNGLHTEYVAAAGLERYLAKAHVSQLKTVEQQMDNERRYETLKNEIDATQKLYDSTLEKVKTAGAASALRSTNVRMIDFASAPSVPYSPKTPLNMAIGFALGSLGGIGFVLVRERSGKVKQPGQVRFFDVPELGVIPSARDARVVDLSRPRLLGAWHRAGELGLVTRNHQSSLMSESFRSALTSILFGPELNRDSAQPADRLRGQVLVITSVDAMAGKTTVLANLGIAATERQRRVLLLDADLRRPRLHEIFNLPNSGLADFLRNGDSAEFIQRSPMGTLARETRIPDLWVVPGGAVNGAPNGVLYSPDLGALLERFRRDFDLILIDTPPMMLYSDARVLARISDGVVMVVRANTRSPEEIEAAYRQFVQDQTPVVGTILNDWRMDPSRTRAYGRYYSQ
jgi:polysaccharide biosynthesis transport protein